MEGMIYPQEHELGGEYPADEAWPQGFKSADLAGGPGPTLLPGSSSKLPGESSLPQLESPPTHVVSVTAYRRVATVGIPFGFANVDQLVLASPGPEVVRSLLVIRNSQTSAGNLLIAFDMPAFDLSAPISLVPGGVVIFDVAVPQNDLHMAATAGGTNAVISYSNVKVPGLNTA